MQNNMAFARYDLEDNNLGDEGATMVAKVLRTTRHIVSLNLSMNRIQSDGAQALAEALSTNQSLIDLNLSGAKAGNNRNRIMQKGAYYLAPVLAQNVFI